MTHAIFSGKMRILQHNTPPKRVRRFPARPRKNTPTRPHERPRRFFAWALPCAKSTHQTATPYSAIFFSKRSRVFSSLSDFIRTQGSGKKRATGRENEASARRRRAAGAPKARRVGSNAAEKKHVFRPPIFTKPEFRYVAPGNVSSAGRFE